MGLFGLVFSAVALVLIGVGIALGLVACAVGAALLSLGVISSSVVIGIQSGRPATGVRAFLLQCGVLAGIPAGAIFAWLAQTFLDAYGHILLVMVYGAIGGAVAGVVVALLMDFIWRRTAAWTASRLPLARGEREHLNYKR